MSEPIVARANVDIHAPVSKVWEALIDPRIIKKYMFGATVESDWTLGSPISWKGEWKGKSYEDKGRILDIQPLVRLQFSHYSPLTGAPDTPESYHNVTIALEPRGSEVHVELSQDNNKSREAAEESQRNWRMMLAGLKEAVER